MRECDSKYCEISFNRAYIITWSRKNITNQCLPRVASRRLVVDKDLRKERVRESEKKQPTLVGSGQ